MWKFLRKIFTHLKNKYNLWKYVPCNATVFVTTWVAFTYR